MNKVLEETKPTRLETFARLELIASAPCETMSSYKNMHVTALFGQLKDVI